jgi:hypothetical protein
VALLSWAVLDSRRGRQTDLSVEGLLNLTISNMVDAVRAVHGLVDHFGVGGIARVWVGWRTNL